MSDTVRQSMVHTHKINHFGSYHGMGWHYITGQALITYGLHVKLLSRLPTIRRTPWSVRLPVTPDCRRSVGMNHTFDANWMVLSITVKVTVVTVCWLS